MSKGARMAVYILATISILFSGASVVFAVAAWDKDRFIDGLQTTMIMVLLLGIVQLSKDAGRR
jgi:heme/copper-type cytochrome/quinol oxidase subunit 3